MRLVLAALLMSLSSSVFANDAELRQKIVGTWTLVSVVYEDQATRELSPVLGEKPRGRQIATVDGRWLALVTAENRPVPKTDEERARALTSMIAYTGRYRVEDSKVITKVEAAWNEAWVGGEQTRFIRKMRAYVANQRRCMAPFGQPHLPALIEIGFRAEAPHRV